MPKPSSPNQLVAGALLAGKYRLLRLLGEGAMGSVWAARNEATTGEVALKLIQRPDPELRQRLQREARAGAVLKHRNILDVYDLAETEAGEPFLVMQLLQGETLADLLARKRRLEPRDAARIARDAALALAAAHERGLVHRDLKPANLFLHNESGSDAPVVKVLDFGVAKDLTGSDAVRTALGTMIGSAPYMSPEQVRGDADVDARSDVWALGVLLFEMLAGARPFQGSAQEIIAAILTAEVPRVSRQLRNVDPLLDRVVDGCLRRDRGARLPSAAAVASLLDEFLASAAARPGARPPPAPTPVPSTSVAPAGTLVLGSGLVPSGDAAPASRPGGAAPASRPGGAAPPSRPGGAAPPSRPGGTAPPPRPGGAAPGPGPAGTVRLAPTPPVPPVPPASRTPSAPPPARSDPGAAVPWRPLPVPMAADEAIEPAPPTPRGTARTARDRRRTRAQRVAVALFGAVLLVGAIAVGVTLRKDGGHVPAPATLADTPPPPAATTVQPASATTATPEAPLPTSAPTATAEAAAEAPAAAPSSSASAAPEAVPSAPSAPGSATPTATPSSPTTAATPKPPPAQPRPQPRPPAKKPAPKDTGGYNPTEI